MIFLIQNRAKLAEIFRNTMKSAVIFRDIETKTIAKHHSSDRFGRIVIAGRDCHGRKIQS